MEFDTYARFKVAGWPAVAVRIHGWPQVWEPDLALMIDDDGNEWEEDTGEGEWVDDKSGDVLVIMIGDDVKHRVDSEALIPLADSEYCSECGQIGCGHGVRS